MGAKSKSEALLLKKRSVMNSDRDPPSQMSQYKSNFQPKKKYSKAALKKMKIQQLKAKFEKNCMDKRYYFPNINIEGKEQHLKSLDEITERTASATSSQRQQSITSKPVLKFQTIKTRNLGVKHFQKFKTTRGALSPMPVIPEFKFPRITQCSEEKSDDEKEVQMEEVDISAIGLDNKLDETQSPMFQPNNPPSFDLFQKSMDNLSIPKTMRNATKRQSIIDLHINDPKRYRKVESKELKSNAYERYRRKCEQLMIVPVRFGIKYKGEQNQKIEAQDYLMGEDHLKAFNYALANFKKISSLNLENNRLGGDAAKELLLKPEEDEHNDRSNSVYNRLLCDDISNLNLSKNPNLPFETYQTISLMVEDGYNILQILNLEGNKMGDKALITICDRSHYNNYLKVLNVSDNNITCRAMPSVAEMLKYINITTILLRWNKIETKGLANLCEGIVKTDSLKILDLSFNPLSKKNEDSDEYPQCLSDMFRENSSLMHMDLSHTGITAEDGKIIEKGLNENHTIFGIHLTGNEIRLTAEGFITKARENDAADSHIMVRVSDSLTMGVPDVKKQIDYRGTTNCWICEGWSEVKFHFDVTTSNIPLTEEDGVLKGVNIHLDFDDYRPDVMKRASKNPNLFYLVKMVPPKLRVRYYFSIALEKTTVIPAKPKKKKSKYATKPKIKKDLYFKQAINERDRFQGTNLIDYQGVFVIPTLHKISVPETNVLENLSINDRMINTTYLADTNSVPRPKKITLDTKILKKEWKREKSIFKDYKLEHPIVTKKCFEKDFNSICGVIKDELDRKKVKEFLSSIYAPLKECYKYYAGTDFTNNVPSIGTNSFTDLLTISGCIDHNLLKLSDISIDFIATNVGQRPEDPKFKHLNPERSLVREEFLQIFIRLANSKYLKAKKLLTYNDAIRQLFNDGLLSYMRNFDSNDFRINKLYNESCDMVFKYYIKSMKRLYFTYSGKHTKPGETRFMCYDEFMKLFSDAGVQSDLFGAKELGIIFNLSMMTQVNEITSERHYKMSFDEFIEAVARVAEGCNLLLVSSSFFGVDLEEEIEKQKNSKFRGGDKAEVLDTNGGQIFSPENILSSQNQSKQEIFSEYSTDSENEESKNLDGIDASRIEISGQEKLNETDINKKNVSSSISGTAMQDIVNIEVEKITEKKSTISRKNSSSKLVPELKQDVGIAHEIYEQIDLAEKIEFLITIMMHNCLDSASVAACAKKKNGWKLLIED
ncbi:unnamed protein product [Moneuplotes crassus]|uniref:Leucine Rich Repeat family protein n=2 Tax=Euplotes crassus TaxID=5936 RepID=A0AAD1UC24_EUPCR|nr:unnamed protein product [Moneuplotes crassus]